MNTNTNILLVAYASHGIYKNAKSDRLPGDAISRSLPYMGIMLVGLGSAIFHSTNLYYTQWADDLSMLFATATVLHRVYTYDMPLKETVLYGGALAGFLIGFSIWHCIMDEVVFHGLIFGIMIIIVGVKTRSIINKNVSDPFVKAEVRKMVWWGTGAFGLGYAFWNADFHGCGDRTHGLTWLKRWIGMPLSFVFEFHGWWHIFTGIGAYIFIALVEYLTSEEAGEPLAGRFAWPVEACCLKKDGKGSKRKLSREERGVTGKLSNGTATSATTSAKDVVQNGNGHLAARMKLT